MRRTSSSPPSRSRWRRPTSGPSRSSGTGATSRTRATSRLPRCASAARWCGPGSAPGAAASSPTASRPASTARATGCGSPPRSSRAPRCSRRSPSVLHDGRVSATGVVDLTQTEGALRQWRSNDRVRWKAPVLEEVLAGLGVPRQALAPVRPGRAPRLHAREGLGRRRRRVRRLVQPVALRRGQRRERARDRRPRCWRTGSPRGSTRSAPAIRRRADFEPPARRPCCRAQCVATVTMSRGSSQAWSRSSSAGRSIPRSTTCSRSQVSSPDQYPSPARITGKCSTSSVMMRLSASNSSSIVPKPPGKTTKPIA